MGNETNKSQSHSYEEGRNYGHGAAEAGVPLVLGNDQDFNQGARDGQTLSESGYSANGTKQVS